MPQRLFDEIKNWANGINTSAAADQLPEGFSPRGRNTALKMIGEGMDVAQVGSRKGALTLNTTPLTGAPGIIGGFQFKKKDASKYNLLVSDTGRLDKLNSDFSTTVINAVGFTAGVHYPAFSVANDLCFIVNDVDQKKFDGTSLTKFGITRPAAPAATAVAAGVAGMAGTYDFAQTYYNSATGHESSLSDFVTVVIGAGQRASVTWLAPADTQVTHVRLYIRKQTLGAFAFRVVAATTPLPDATTGGFPVATLATLVDIADATINAFIILAPSTTENNPPAAGLQYPCFHADRMFLADAGNIYYSNIKDGVPYPEAFNPNNFQPVNPQDGDTITAMFSMWGKLYIWKRFSLWEVVGTDPNSWTVSLVGNDYGTPSFRSIVAVEGVLYWWAGVNGPVQFSGGASFSFTPVFPLTIGKQFLASTITAELLNQTGYTSIAAGVDEANQTIIWAVPEFNNTRNTKCIPFNYRAKRFGADHWNPFDVYSMWTVESIDHLRAMYIGGYAGQVFQWWAAGNDGVPAGTTTAGTVSSSTATTLTDTTAAFSNVGGKLVERYVYALSSDRQTIQRRRIISNTATVLTISAAWDSNPDSTWTYVVGAIDFQLDTPWLSAGATFMKKRYEFLYLEAGSIDIGTSIDIDVFMSMDESAPRVTRNIALGGTGGLYDAATSLYDTTLYGANTVTFGKIRLATVGKTCRIRLRSCKADHDISVYRIMAQSVPLGLNR